MTESILSEHVRQKIEHWLQKFPPDQRQSALLPALTLAQEQNKGWLTNEFIEAVADYLEIPHIAAYEAATFYSMYDLEPVGKHKIHVCVSISCMLRGSEDVLGHLRKRLGIKEGETTPDGLFTLKKAECLAACANAPMMRVDNEYYEDLTIQKIDAVLDQLTREARKDDE